MRFSWSSGLNDLPSSGPSDVPSSTPCIVPITVPSYVPRYNYEHNSSSNDYSSAGAPPPPRYNDEGGSNRYNSASDEKEVSIAMNEYAFANSSMGSDEESSNSSEAPTLIQYQDIIETIANFYARFARTRPKRQKVQ